MEVSRQIRYQRRHRLEGLCLLCPNKVCVHSKLCEKHLLKNRLIKRFNGGWTRWRKGSPGRPPLEHRLPLEQRV